MLKIKSLNFKNILKDINLEIPNNKLTAIIGANGAGKSTLLKLIAGILKPNNGQIIYSDNEKELNLTNLSIKKKSQIISYLAQNTPIHWDIHINELILLGLANYDLSKNERQERLEKIIKYLKIEPLINKSIMSLSGGELARVHLARALITDNPILLADEPTASLDPYFQLEIMNILEQQSKQKTGIVVLHNLDIAMNFCENFILIDNGGILATGDKQTVITNENLAKAYSIKADISNNSIGNICQI